MNRENMFKDTVKDAVSELFTEDVKRLDYIGIDEHKEMQIEARQIDELCLRILAMPEEAKNLLFSRYCFRMSEDAIGEIFHIDFPRGKLIHYQNMLAKIMRIEEGHRISEQSFERACSRALDQYIENEVSTDDSVAKVIKTLNRTWSITSRWVAAAGIIVFLGFGVTITTNAKIREMIVEWYIRSFKEYSVVQTEGEFITLDTIKKYKPGFVPERYHFIEIIESTYQVNYLYQDDELNNLDIILQLPGEEVYADTEGMTVENMELNEADAYYMTDGSGYGTFAFSVDGIPVFISGYLDREEMIAIAEAIGR